jgi:hypothetical protein
MSDRLYLAAEVTRRMNYLRNDTLELARLLRGETLSEGFHESLVAVIRDLQQIAESAKPSAPAGPKAEAPEQAATQARALERADAA